MNGYSALITEFSNPARVKLLLLLDDQNAVSFELTKQVGEISNLTSGTVTTCSHYNAFSLPAS